MDAKQYLETLKDRKVPDGITHVHVSGWELHYLKQCSGRSYVRLPVSSRSAEKLIDYGLIESFGLISGAHVEFRLTPLGRETVQRIVSDK